MATDVDEDKLYVGASEGCILCLNFGKYGKEKKNTKEFTYSLPSKRQCSVLRYDEDNQGLLAGNESGNVSVWHPDINVCSYVFNAHHKRISTMHWNHETRRLYTGSNDGKIKVWQLPEDWTPDEIIFKKPMGKLLLVL